MRGEWVITVEGTVRQRPEEMVNPDMATGAIEVSCTKLAILNPATQKLPFPVSQSEESADEEPREELRLKHRSLDLRRQRMNANIR